MVFLLGHIIDIRLVQIRLVQIRLVQSCYLNEETAHEQSWS